jgi:hypothetical protein
MDSQSIVEWRNAGRYQAYDLSPYDETLVIDVDYLVLDTQILKIFETNWDYLLQRSSQGLVENFNDVMGTHSLPYSWATVFAFRKTKRSRLFFSLVKRVQDNYSYYRELFNIDQRMFRNDYAFSIADIILNGYTINTDSIPGTLLHINHPIKSIESFDDLVVIRDEKRAYIVPRMNMHIMSKAYLQSRQFEEFVSNVKP